MGLRGRVAAAFGLGAFAVSVLLAVTTYTIASNYLLSQRLDSVLRQAIFNAQAVNDALQTTRPAVEELLEQLDRSGGEASSALVRYEGEWYDDQFAAGHDALPEEFLAAAEAGRAVEQRIDTPTGVAVAIALPLAQSGGLYIEVFTLRELDRTLNTLAVTSAGAATATTLLGLLLGVWASRRSLAPLSAVNTAASAIAAGDLDARLKAPKDPDLRPLAEAFNETAGRLQTRVERDARFAANVSHELRTPLTTMVNAVEVMQGRSGKLDHESREVLDLLSSEVHRFARMVEDLLEISRVDADITQLRQEPVRLAGLVRVVADRCAGRRVTEVVEGAEGLVCTGDKRRLERVIENLVSNAESHGGGVFRVVVSPHGRRVRIAVEDKGPGVPPGEERRIFERFARSKSQTSATDGGSGLGLALVSEHVRLHGGRVWVEQRHGGGARFVVELPLEDT